MALDTRRIAKNTMYMYFRMILVMMVSIYTSRVVLDKLGVEDFGLYNAVNSVVAVITFVTTTLNTSTSRFLAYALGSRNSKESVYTFSTIFYLYIVFTLLIVMFLESAGLWYINNTFVCPGSREFAVSVVFQISIVIVILNFIEVPFTSVLVAHEDLNIYAYIGILDVILRLLVVYILVFTADDKLIIYAFLILVSKLIISGLYIIYSGYKYNEVTLRIHFSRRIFKNIVGFTGWTLLANVCNTIVVQGSILLMNLFFSPAIIASKALATQINGALMQFVSNFRTAVNPQIIKSYSAGDIDSFKKLTLISTIFCFDLLLIMGLPFVFTMDKVLSLWLVDVPPFALEFTQLTIIGQFISIIDNSFYTSFVAVGKIKKISLIGFITSLTYFLLLYIIYKCGGNVLWTQYLLLISYFMWAFFIKPYMMHKMLNYSLKELMACLVSCVKVFVLSLLFSLIGTFIFDNSLIQQICLFGFILLSTAISSWICLDAVMKQRLIELVKAKLNK